MITVSTSSDACKPCGKKENRSAGKRHIGLFSGILLALLPKCPFCFVAFSGTLILCGNGGGISTHTFSSAHMLAITISICFLTLISVLLNFRGVRTRYAILLVVLGSAMTIFSVTTGGGLPLYYLGVIVIFVGVWLNASLLFFVRKLKR